MQSIFINNEPLFPQFLLLCVKSRILGGRNNFGGFLKLIFLTSLCPARLSPPPERPRRLRSHLRDERFKDYFPQSRFCGQGAGGGRWMGARSPPQKTRAGGGRFPANLSFRRAPPQRGGNFVRLNLKKKSHVRGYALRGNRLRKQVTSRPAAASASSASSAHPLAPLNPFLIKFQFIRSGINFKTFPSLTRLHVVL